MRSHQLSGFCALAVLFCVAPSAGAGEPDAAARPSASGTCADMREAPLISLTSEQVKWAPVPLPPQAAPLKFAPPRMAILEGVEGSDCLIVRELEYEPGVRSTPHKHPTAERTYVVSGSIRGVVGDGSDKDAVLYKAGSYMTVPANTRHYAFSQEKARVLVLQVGRPTSTPAP